MDIGYNVKVSRRAILDYSANPQGIHIGNNVMITGNVIILSHDYLRGIMADTYIGNNCFIGNGSMVLPGVKIGNHVAVGAGSVITKDIPSNSIVAGNPARIIRTGVVISNKCQIAEYGIRV